MGSFARILLILFLPLNLLAQSGDFARVDSLAKSGNYDAAIVAVRKSAAAFKLKFDWENYFVAIQKEAKYLGKKSLWQESLTLIEKQIIYCHEVVGKGNIHEVKLLKEKASAEKQLSGTPKALSTLRQAEFISREHEYLPELLSVLMQAGGMTYQDGDYNSSLPFHREAVAIGEIVDESDSLKLGRLNYLLGSCYWGIDEVDSCKKYYQNALQYWLPSQGEKFSYVGEIYNVLGEFAWRDGNKAQALQYFNKYALTWNKELTPGKDYADQLIDKASAQTNVEQLSTALEHYKEALLYREQILGKNNPSAVGCYNYIARVLSQMGDPEKALKICQQAITKYCPGFKTQNDFQNPKSIDSVTSYQLLLDVLIQKFDLLISEHFISNTKAQSSADEIIDLCIILFDELRTGRRTEDSKVFWSEQIFPFIENALSYYHAKNQKSFTTNTQNRILELMEKGKAFMLNEALANNNAIEVSRIPLEVLSEERELLDKLNNALRFFSIEEKKCEVADTVKLMLWSEEISALRLKHELLIDQIEQRFPDYFKLKYEVTVATLSDIRSHLKDGEGLVQYFYGIENVYRIIIDRTEFEFECLGPSSVLQEKIATFHHSLTDIQYVISFPQKAFDDFSVLGSELFEILLREKNLPNKIIIIPDGPLSVLPFEVLLCSSTKKPAGSYTTLDYLIKHTEVSYVISATSWIGLIADRKSKNRYAGFAPSYSSATQSSLFVSRAGIVPLRYNDDEVLAAQNIFGGDSFLGAQAMESTFRNVSADAGILHMAMHTILNDSLPLFSGFLFDHEEDSLYDGILSAEEIYTLNLHAQMVLLSACNTGTGEYSRGEGIMSLARAFNYAGCPALVYSLWECDDECTNGIITDFLNGLEKGLNKSEALREARLKFLSEADPQFSHPYYWSGLVLMGNQDPISRNNSTPWITGGCALILAIVISKKIRKRKTSGQVI